MAESIDIISIGEGLIELSAKESLTYTNTFDKYFGGDTLSAAVTAARLGSNVGYITKIGNDTFQDYLMDCLHAEDIDTSYVRLVEGYNGLYFISRLESGEKETAYYRKKSAATLLSIDDIPEEYIEKASIVYSSGITQSLSDSARESVLKAFKIAKEKQCLVAYDPNYRARLWNASEAKEALEEVIEYVDIIFVSSLYDAEKLYGLSSADKIIKFFWDMGVATVAVKLGKDGCEIGYNGEIAHIPAYTSQVVDTTGSGDVFNGAFLHGIAVGYSAFEAARLASITAGLQIKDVGAVKPIPYKEQVYQEFKSGEK